MRVMVIVKANRESEAGQLPSTEMLAATRAEAEAEVRRV